MSLSPRALASGAVLGLLCASACVSAPARAAGSGPAKWTEWHVTGDDVSITVDRAGMARVEHALRYRVVMGPMRGLDLTGIEKEARLGPDATITAEDGREVAASVEPKGDAGLHVTVADAKGLKRGTYTFRLHYDVDLVAARELARDGAMWKLAWRSPVAAEGYDAARVLVSVPAAQTEPRRVRTGAEPEASGGGDGDDDRGREDGVIATLHRTPERDELELVRPHVTRGEAPLWAARLDPKAFPDVRAPEMRPAPPAAPAPPNRLREASWAVGLAAIALLFGALVRAKMRAFAAACAGAKVIPAPLVSVSPNAAGLGAGLAAAGGLALQALAWPTAGGALIAVAMLMGVSRTPVAKRAPRGPGRWVALRSDDAFAREVIPTCLASALDLGTRAGKIAVALASIGAAAAAVLLRTVAPEAPYLVALDALALVPLFATGRAAQLPPDPARAPAPALRAAMRALNAHDRKGGAKGGGKGGALTIVPWARVPIGAERADELRLLVVPRASLPGLAGIELGVAWRRTATAWAPSFEVLVRAHDGSDAAARLAALAPFARPLTGRKPEEKVVVLTPRVPGRAAAVALVLRVARELVDRRLMAEATGAWKGTERRAGWERTDEIPAAA
jgi:hypothetical protein